MPCSKPGLVLVPKSTFPMTHHRGDVAPDGEVCRGVGAGEAHHLVGAPHITIWGPAEGVKGRSAAPLTLLLTGSGVRVGIVLIQPRQQRDAKPELRIFWIRPGCGEFKSTTGRIIFLKSRLYGFNSSEVGGLFSTPGAALHVDEIRHGDNRQDSHNGSCHQVDGSEAGAGT